MSHVATASVARQLGALFAGGSAAGLSDRQLLERFAADRDQAAFAAIVARHGPMVLGVCRQLLGDRHEAEDAFQAVFLVLARKAGSLRQPELLGNWLYGVALHTARRARGRLTRRRQTEEAGAISRPEAQSAAPAEPLIDREQSEMLHVEIDRLPGNFRAPVVLCYFEGLTLDEAAHRLRWPVGTTRSRLARAREKLRRGLTRRGFALSATATAAMLVPRSASASVSSLLCETTTRAAIHFAARHAAGGALAAPAAALAQEVLCTMLLHKLKAAALSLMILAVVAAGAGWLARPLVRGDEPKMQMKGQPTARDPSTAATRPSGAHPNPARMTVTGRVLDPSGKPIPGARVAALGDRKTLAGDRDGRHLNVLMGSAEAGPDGRFTLDMTAPSASRLEFLRLIAAAPGRALTAVDLKTDAERQEASIAMPPEKPVEGRLVDVQGQPAAGVVVRVARLNLAHVLHPYDAKGGPVLWPSPATTDADGRFRILGLGAGAPATYEVEDPRYAHQSFAVGAAAPGEGNPRPGSTVTLRPAQAVEVHVVHRDTGTPVAGARVAVQSFNEEGHLSNNFTFGRTDAQGRARVVGWPATGYRIHVAPAEGEPYLPAGDDIDWPKGAVEQTCEFKLWRSVVVRGKVVEEPSGQPVAGAWVVYNQRVRDNPRANGLENQAVTGPDGTFRMVVMPGPGHLLALGPGDDYVNVRTSYGEMGTAHAPWFYLYPNAHIVLDIQDGKAEHPVEIRLRRGVTITGRVVGPDGRPIAEASAFGRSYTPYREYTFPLVGFNGEPPRIEVKDGRFEIPGCDPEKPGTFYFIDVKDGLGATVELSGKSAAAGPVTVRLQPTAKVHFRLTGPDGKPAAGREPEWPYYLKLVITPGPDFLGILGTGEHTAGDFVGQVDVDRAHNFNLRSGADGRVTMINLIPGARYRFRGHEFTPETRQTVDLGDVPAPKPAE
jgi:RNA polymerase sigma factor (sigma-70 family)